MDSLVRWIGDLAMIRCWLLLNLMNRWRPTLVMLISNWYFRLIISKDFSRRRETWSPSRKPLGATSLGCNWHKSLTCRQWSEMISKQSLVLRCGRYTNKGIRQIWGKASWRRRLQWNPVINFVHGMLQTDGSQGLGLLGGFWGLMRRWIHPADHFSGGLLQSRHQNRIISS